jgi:Zn-dependent protease with chaperone function
MAVAPGPGGRATLDFFAAQAEARRRTAVLVVSFALACCVVVAVVYAALVAVAATAVPRADLPLELPAGLSGISGRPSLFQPALLVLAAALVGAVTGLGTAYHAVRLAAGGGEAVAEMLGGVRLDRDAADPAERRLVNVTEEMAIAAGLPVPHLYVLSGEPGINAFAAGYTPGHAVVAVTRGALDKLSRDELQGVLAHELSHVLNADTRVDLRLMAAVGGLTVLALLGRLILRGTSSSRSRDSRGRGAALLVGLAFLLAGAFGALCGKLVRYAVARQREWLADASAVQFTRNPDGLAGALRKIAAEGSALRSPHAPEAAHIFFASAATGFLAGLFSTHPPIEERIRRLAPHAAARTAAAREAGPAVAGPASPPAAVSRPAAGPAVPLPAAAPLQLPFRPVPEHLPLASALRDRLPATLAAAAREPFGARALACALLLGDAPEARRRQLEALAGRDPALGGEAGRLASAAAGLPRADRMALLGLSLPALDGLSPAQAGALAADLGPLAAPGAAGTFELLVRRAVLRRLARDAGRPPRPRLRQLDEVGPECLEVLSALAWIGGRDEIAAQAALDAGVRALGAGSAWRLLPRDRAGAEGLDAALAALDEAAPAVKARLLEACAATALADRRVGAGEAELVRAVAAALGLPLPPVLEGAATPGA